jgi:hypothetical protein
MADKTANVQTPRYLTDCAIISKKKKKPTVQNFLLLNLNLFN